MKAAVWAAGHLGTSEAGVALLESASVVESFIHIASHSPVYALRGTAFYALNLVAMTTAGVEILSRLGAPFFLFFFIIIIFVFFFHLCEILQVLFGNRFWVVEFLLKRKRAELIVCDIGCNEIVDRLGVH